MMKKAIVLMALCSTMLPLAAKPAPKIWACYVPSTGGGEYQVEGKTDKAFKMTFKRTESNAKNVWASAIVNIDREMWSQNKLVFSCRGLNNKEFRLGPQVSFKDGKKVTLRGGTSMMIKGTAWRDVVMNLDSDFRLGDASYFIRQLKFSVNISNWKPGEAGGLEIKNIRLCTPSEVSLTGAVSRDIIVYPKEKRPLPTPKNPLRIYFHMDNEDMIPVPYARNKRPVNDHQQYAGFRETMLESVRDQAVLTDDLDNADLIVYASCLPKVRESKKIAEKVKSGTPILVASEVADPAIAELLPCTLNTPVATDIPPRKALKFADKNHPVAKNGGLNPAKFGVYRTLSSKNGKAILLFADGTPAVLEGMAGKGKVIYSTLSLGAGVIPGKKAFDAFTLRLAGYLTGKNLREENEPSVKPDRDGWYEGAGKNNFGRFGWEIGDGLLVESIGTRLNVTNGIGEYEFSLDTKEKISLFRWNFTGLDKKTKPINWNVSWSDIGVVSLETSVKIPSIWKGKKILFYVEKGIDDTAAVYFNGKKIGEVTKDVHQYWMTPHRYVIPENLIRFDQENQVKVLTENLRGNGSFGSCPEILVEEPEKKMSLVFDRINHIGKGGVISIEGKKAYRFDTSMAFPGIRWEFFRPSVVLSLYNIANYAAYRTEKGIRILDLSKVSSIPTDWSAPWLLLFGGGEGDNPMLLVFQHRMKNINLVRNGEHVGGIELKSEKSIGMIVPLWIGGSAPQNTVTWKKDLPAGLLKKIEFWYPRAFRYPDFCREDFRIDRKNRKIEIRDTFRYLESEDDWKTRKTDYAPVPALAYLMKGKLFESKEAEGRDLVTNFGYFADRNGSKTVHWTLPLPEPDHSLLPHTKGFKEFEDIANRHFARGVLFSAGGGTKYESRNAVYPMGKGMPWVHNLNMHSSLMGMLMCTENPYIYNQENRQKMRQRLVTRLFEPLERYQYKMVSRWREEPYSGIRYTNYMNSPRDVSTKYAPGFGTKILYGDSNETVQMMLTGIQRMADRFGQKDLVLANWDVIKRHIASFPLVQDDWGYLTSGCLDYGGAASIDMLNCEYSSMMKLARIAEIAKDDAMRDQALYRAARRMVPTLARFEFHSYAAKNRILNNPELWSISTGFGEGGCQFRRAGAEVRDVELYDMSQGIPRDLIHLYSRYGADQVLRSKYLNDVRNTDPAKLDYCLGAALAINGDLPDAELLGILKGIAANQKRDKRLCSDWPGMGTGSYMEYVLYRLKGKVLVATAKDVDLKEASFDPANNEFTLQFIPGKDAELILWSSMKPVSPAYRQDAKGFIHIAAKKSGVNDLKIKFN